MRRLISFIGIFLLLFVGVGLYVGKRFYESAEEPYRGYTASDVFVEIHRCILWDFRGYTELALPFYIR